MASTTSAQDATTPKPTDSIGYLIGYSLGQSLRQQGYENGDFDMGSFVAGITDAIQGQKPALPDEQLIEAQGRIQAILNKRNTEAQAKVSAENKAKGEAFLKENATAEGVQELAGGLQYKVLQQGNGASPDASDTVSVHYTGKLIDGTVFDSSVQRGEPLTLEVGGVIAGWQMALQKMKVGDKWMLYVPAELAYGANGPPVIGPNQALVFEVELLDIR